MKFAFYPCCVARGATPELFSSVMAVSERLGIELMEIERAACTGAGVLQEKDRKLGDVLNIRTLAMAEQTGLTMLTICSTCQGVLSQANHSVKKNPDYLAEINEVLKDEGLEYKGNARFKHLMWALIEDIGIDKVKQEFKHELTGVNLAPFYGCYIVRPSDALELNDNPGRARALEELIEATGATVIDFKGKTACCGFPILFINQRNSLKMVSNHTGAAADLGADGMVTPCPLCHLNLDGYQAKARKDNRGDKANLPIIHLPQLIGLAMGIDLNRLGLSRHFVSTKKFISKLNLVTA